MNEIEIRNDELNTQDEFKKECISLVDMQSELDHLEAEIAQRKEKIKQTMEMLKVKSIRFQTGNFITYVSKKNIKVNKKLCEIFLDSQGVKEQFMKLDETAVKKIYYKPESNNAYDFITEDKPTTYITIK